MKEILLALTMIVAGAKNLEPNRAYSLTLHGMDFVCFTANHSWADECFLLGEDWQ